VKPRGGPPDSAGGTLHEVRGYGAGLFQEVRAHLAADDKVLGRGQTAGAVRWLILVLAVAFSLMHLYTAYFGVFPMMVQRSLHVTGALVLIFLWFPLSGQRLSGLKIGTDLLFLLGALAGGGYIFVTYHWIRITPQVLGRPPPYEVILGVIFIVVILEACRRTLGWGLPIITVCALVYAYVGPILPGLLAHRGYTLNSIIAQMYTYSEGIFGTPVGVTSTFIVLFIVFAALLEVTGIGEFFTRLAHGMFGAIRGGPAKAAVFSSALMGSITGSAAANVSSTGSFTIPLMRRVGYKPAFAGGVEAAASSGGQIMPPIMGAAAFLIAESLGMPYRTIILVALVPAILYFISIFVQVDFEAGRLGLKGLPRKELPKVGPLLLRQGFMLLPLGVLVFALVGLKVSAMRAAFWGVMAVIVIGLLNRHHRLNVSRLLIGLENGARASIPIVGAVAAAGLVIGVITLTGLGLRLSSLLAALAGGSLFLLLVFTAISSIILGMGLPTVAAYLVLSVTTAPALITLGVEPLAAHLFIFYFGVISAITPPVALAAFAAAGIARESPMLVAAHAMKLALAAFIIPFMFVYQPVLLLQSDEWLKTVLAIVTAVVGVSAFGAGIAGYVARKLAWWERLGFSVGGLILVYPGIYSDAVGAIMVGGAVLVHFWFRRSVGPALLVYDR
jgi:TRAP transporter 4TM/12TM fusion protein